MKSYDRLFPNQDTMPKGGFGNLIALPLQKVPTEAGNTVFIDDSFMPYQDQWAFLQSIRKISQYKVRQFVDEVLRIKDLMGIRISQTDDKGQPWESPANSKRVFSKLICPLPEKVSAVMANRLYIRKDGLPSQLLTRIKRLASFQNPEFYKKQSMRFSTALTPRVICCAEEVKSYLAIPRGCKEDLERLMSENQIALSFDDKRHSGIACSFEFHGDLTDVQNKALRELIKHDTGIFVAPPGIGKTVIGIRLIAERKTNTLVLVHRKPLLEQWRAQIAAFLDIPIKEVGQIGGGKDKATGLMDVAMIQSMTVVLHGGMRAPLRKEMLSKLADVPDNEERLILATGPYIGEGFDDPRLDTLFLVMPFSFKGKMVQYAGRLHRQYEGKTEVRIYDYVDSMPIFEKMFKKRLKAYNVMGYKET